MERNKIANKLQSFLSKYKFVFLILMIGLFLMLLPDGNGKKEAASALTDREETADSVSQQLEAILSTVRGAGRVRVMLTEAAGEEVIYQTDNDQTTNDSNGTSRTDTVVITDSERNESGLIKNRNAPVYRGALVVCDGAQTPAVALAVVDAVSKVTGLSTDKISVLKME